MPRLYLIRHAEPALRGVLLGQADPPLSDAGREQARSLRVYEARALYTSPLRRATETASLVDVARNAFRREIPNLAEISYGEWNGKSWTEIEETWPEHAALKRRDWFGVVAPGGEDWQAFERRVDAALEQIRYGPWPAVVVAHLAVNAHIGSRLTGLDASRYMQEYAEVRRLEF